MIGDGVDQVSIAHGVEIPLGLPRARHPGGVATLQQLAVVVLDLGGGYQMMVTIAKDAVCEVAGRHGPDRLGRLGGDNWANVRRSVLGCREWYSAEWGGRDGRDQRGGDDE